MPEPDKPRPAMTESEFKEWIESFWSKLPASGDLSQATKEELEAFGKMLEKMTPADD